MTSRSSILVARALWLFPAVLLLLTFYLADAALDLRETLMEGIPATAEITDFASSDRVDVTYDYVSLRAELPDGQVIAREQLSFPHSFAEILTGQETLEVRVLPGADQEIVIVRVGEQLIGRPQWRIAAIQAGMSFVAFLLAAAGVFAWNRYLRRSGDPADRYAEAELGEHPAQAERIEDRG